MGCDTNKRPAWILSRIIVGSRSESLWTLGNLDVGCHLWLWYLSTKFHKPEYQTKFAQKLEPLSSTSELHGVGLNKWFTEVQWRILKLEDITQKNVYGCTTKKACGLQTAECMQALQAGARKLILYFLLLKLFCATFFEFHNLNEQDTETLRFTRIFHSCCIWQQDY